MIDSVLLAVVAEFNNILNCSVIGAGDLMALGPVPDSAKDSAPPSPLSLSLVRIEEERVRRTQFAVRRHDEQVDTLHPNVNLNLYVLVSAHGQSYRDALKHLSSAVLFFQSRPHFDLSGYPGLDEVPERILVELCSQTFEEQNHLWGALSVRYVPSVLYRLRMLSFQSGKPLRTAPLVQTTGVSESGT